MRCGGVRLAPGVLVLIGNDRALRSAITEGRANTTTVAQRHRLNGLANDWRCLVMPGPRLAMVVS
jgi:hypothetical protein